MPGLLAVVGVVLGDADGAGVWLFVLDGVGVWLVVFGVINVGFERACRIGSLPAEGGYKGGGGRGGCAGGGSWAGDNPKGIDR